MMEQSDKGSRRQKKSLTQRTLERLRNDIISGDLAPGTVIRDVELARHYGVSTSPVREALIFLEMEQLVVMASQRVRQVSPLSRKITMETAVVLAALMQQAFAMGYDKLSDSDWAIMDGYIAEVRNAQQLRDTHLALIAGRRFHDIVVRAAQNDTLRRSVIAYAGWFERIFTLAIPIEDSGWPELMQEILDALRTRDQEKVLFAVRKHHEIFFDKILRLPLRG